MVERICPSCAADNTVEAERCHACGASFPRPLARRATGALARRKPADTARWQQAGKAVALGAVALAVEVGASWLQQRSARKAPREQGTALARPRPQRTGFVARQRVWETYEGGELRERVVERTMWRLSDD